MHPRQMRETVIPVLPSFAYCIYFSVSQIDVVVLIRAQLHHGVKRLSRSFLIRASISIWRSVEGRNGDHILTTSSGRSRLGDCAMTRAKVVAMVMNELGVDMS